MLYVIITGLILWALGTSMKLYALRQDMELLEEEVADQKRQLPSKPPQRQLVAPKGIDGLPFRPLVVEGRVEAANKAEEMLLQAEQSRVEITNKVVPVVLKLIVEQIEKCSRNGTTYLSYSRLLSNLFSQRNNPKELQALDKHVVLCKTHIQKALRDMGFKIISHKDGDNYLGDVIFWGNDLKTIDKAALDHSTRYA